MNQQLANEKGAWEQDRELLKRNLQEVKAEAEAEHQKLQRQIESDKAEVSHYRLEAQEAVGAKQAIARTLANTEASTRSGKETSLEVEKMRAELSKIQGDFAEELGSARARLAVVEQRNKDLLESLESLQSLQSAVQSHAPRSERPMSLPAPPSALPNGSYQQDFRAQQHVAEPQVAEARQLYSDGWKGWTRQKQQADQYPWDFHRAAEVHELWPPKGPQDGNPMNSSTSSLESLGHFGHIGRLGRLPTALPAAPSMDDTVGSAWSEPVAPVGLAIRRAAARRRAQGKATRALDDEYAQFVKDTSAQGRTGPQISSREIIEGRQGAVQRKDGVAAEPFTLGDLGST